MDSDGKIYLKDFRDVVLYKNNLEILKDRFLKNKGETKRNGDFIVTKLPRLTNQDSLTISKEADKYVSDGVLLEHKSNPKSLNPTRFLLGMIDNLLQSGCNRIPQTIFQFELPQKEDKESINKFIELLQDYYRTFLDEYKKILEVNFPTFCRFFKLYSKMPFTLMVGIDIGSGLVEEFYCFDEKPEKKSVIHVARREKILYATKNHIYCNSQMHKFGGYRTYNFIGTFIKVPFMLSVDNLRVKKSMRLRNKIYQQILDEYKEAFKEYTGYKSEITGPAPGDQYIQPL